MLIYGWFFKFKVNSPNQVKTPTSSKSCRTTEVKTTPPQNVISKPKTPAKKKLDFTSDDRLDSENDEEALMASPRKISRTPKKKPPIEEILVVKSIETPPPPPPSRPSNTSAKQRIVNSPRQKKSHLAE